MCVIARNRKYFCKRPHSDSSNEDEKGVLEQKRENLPFMF
jgi:hypothetical protein